jgi:hypothetical protein
MNADILSDLDRVGFSSTSSFRPSASSNAKTQRRKDAKPTQPPIWPTDHTDRPRCFQPELGDPALPTTPSPPFSQKRRGAETQRRREVFTEYFCVARFRPPDEGFYRSMSCGEAPWPSDGHGATGPGNRHESSLSRRFSGPVACALEERRPRHFSSSLNSLEGHAPPSQYEREERQNRRAMGTSAGEKAGGDGCSHPESSVFSPAAGDLQIACRSAFNKRKRFSNLASASLRLCAFASLRSLSGGRVDLRDLWANLGGWVALRLRVSAPLRFSWRSPLVSWCLGGSKKIESWA